MIEIDRPDHFAIRFGRLLPPVAAWPGEGARACPPDAASSPILFVSPPCALFARREVSAP